MTVVKPIVLLVMFGVLLSLPASSLAEAATTGAHPAGKPTTAAERKLLRSPQLWATIDVCKPSDQPNTVGVRGSMPGDELSKDEMYMSFRLQYLDETTKQWVDLSSAAPAYVPVGAAKTARQGGSSFELQPVAGKPPFKLRGVVDFQWRRGATVEYTVSRPTTAAHESLAGADPKGFSAAECSLG